MRGESKLSSVKELAAAFGLVGVVLGAMFLYAGTWPPMVIIESGSMMHPSDTVPYGRFGTIDPGDIILVKGIDGREDVETWAEGGRERYGRPGDVVVYYPYNVTRTADGSRATPVIHRAMAWVDVLGAVQGEQIYRVHWVDGRILTFGPEGIYMPELGFDERGGFSPTNGYRPPASGWITQGDNPATNDRADQASADRSRRLSDLVQPGWVIGVGRGEVPWFGLVKLVFGGDFNQANPPLHWIRVGNAFAPYDLWTMLGFCVVAIVLAPLSWDVYRAWRERLEAKRALERERARARGELPPDDDEEPAAFEEVDADPAAFAPEAGGGRDRGVNADT